MKQKNELYKTLEKEAQKLPPETYKARVVYPNSVIQDNIERKKALNLPIDEDDRSYEDDYPVNHKRRMKTVFKDEGLQGVIKYINKRKVVLN